MCPIDHRKLKSLLLAVRQKGDFFCPFDYITRYSKLRGDYLNQDEPFFIFRDRSPVKPHHLRKIIRQALEDLSLDSSLYNCQSLRIGRATDLQKGGVPVEEIKLMGRWKSNAVYKYLRNF